MDLQLEFSLSLRRITAVRIASILWEQPPVKMQVQQLVLDKVNTYDLPKPIEIFLNDCIMRPYLERFHCFVLPSHLIHELLIVIKALGKKMYDWYMRIANLYENDLRKIVSCMSKICWTHYGSVDYKKTFELVWLGNSELSKRDIFLMASNYCIEDYIKNHWEPPSEHFREFPLNSMAGYWHAYFSNDLNRCETEVNNILSRDIQFNIYNQFSLYRRLFSISNGDRIPLKIFVFVLAAVQGYSEAVKYFWYALSDDQRNKFIVPLMPHLVRSLHDRMERYAQTSAFFLHIITSENIFRDYQSHPCVLECMNYFCALWPWHEIISTNLKILWTFPKLWDAKVGGTQISEYLNNIELYDYDVRLPHQTAILVQHIWANTPKHIKLLCEFNSLKKLAFNLLQKNKIEIATQIVNDDDLSSIKAELVITVAQTYISASFYFDLSILERFLDAVSESETIKNAIKLNLNVKDRFTACPSLIELFLKWQSKITDIAM